MVAVRRRYRVGVPLRRTAPIADCTIFHLRMQANTSSSAPDDYDMTDPDNPVAMRPTHWRDIHRWAGWAEKQV